jgi:8-oxo-dGTP diphosphatase
MIEAAGVILWRERQPLELEVALIHRPKYDDWSFPKGVKESGENFIETAFRECIEETGIRPVLGPYLGEVEYLEENGKKRVSYWIAKEDRIVHRFQENPEVDKLAWMSVKEARHFLTYEKDREILRKFVKSERHVTSTIFLRHAKAVKRSEWFGEDSDRPLSSVGQLQVSKLSGTLVAYGIMQVHSSDAIRCCDTIQSFAKQMGIDSVISSQLSEDVYKKDDNVAINYVVGALKRSGNQLICGHNPILKDMLLAFDNGKKFAKYVEKLSPADFWVIHHVGSRIVVVDYVPGPVVEKAN